MNTASTQTPVLLFVNIIKRGTERAQDRASALTHPPFANTQREINARKEYNKNVA